MYEIDGGRVEGSSEVAPLEPLMQVVPMMNEAVVMQAERANCERVCRARDFRDDMRDVI